jgi:hypothetical protein
MAAVPAHFLVPQLLGYRKNGAPIYTIAGAEDGGQPVATAEPATTPPATATVTPTAPAPTDPGFPPNTPLEQMNGDQREAYWRFQARKHEGRVKALNGLTPEQLADLQDKATKHDALERELMSDKDKAIAEAKDNTAADVAAQFVPRLVNAELKAAAALKGVPAESLSTALEYVDAAKFLDAKGEDVDTDKVAAFVESIAPATGTSTTSRLGPTSHGLGARQPGNTKATVATGAELYASRHPQKSN